MSARRWRGIPVRGSRGLLGCLGLFIVLGLFACGGQAEVTPEADLSFATPEPTVGHTSTATPSRTPTARPTATAYPTRTPTRTPTESPTPTATLTLTPTGTLQTPGVVAQPSRPATGGDTPRPANVNPLTGQVVDDPAVLERRPLAVKLGNDPIVRPQWGLALADVVYEHLSEAGITRFTAIFWSRDAARVGGVRSARFVDLEIPAMYQSLLAFSGVSPGLIPKFQSADFRTWQISPDPYWRDPGFYRDIEAGLGLPYNLFTSTDRLWSIASERGVNQRPDLCGLTWQVEVPSGGTPGAWLEIPFAYRPMRVRWEVDAERGVYERSQGGEPHVAAETGEPLVADNVAVLFVHHVTTDIVESRGGARSIQIQLWGTGPAVLFRDGQAYEGLWARPSRPEMVVLRDPVGQVPLDLRPGSLWVQLVPLDMHIDYGR